MKTKFILSSFFVLTACSLRAQPITAPCVWPADFEIPVAQKIELTTLCRLVNLERARAGLRELRWDAQASRAAQAHADDMVARDYFSHSSPEGEIFTDRLDRVGMNYSEAAENIAYGQRSSESVMKSWMESPGHRANILHGAYRKLGLGVADRKWVQTFTD